jgi:hypothetical protein
MPASFTLTPDPRIPESTVLSVYTGSQLLRDPGGTAVTTATVTARQATFTGLAYDTEYTAGATISGAWRATRFRTKPDPGVEYATKARLPVDVRDFDGIDLTGNSDSSSAMTQAIAQSVADNRRLYIPGGTLRLAQVLLKSGTHIVGDGSRRTILKLLPDSVQGILTTYDGTDTSIDDVTLEGFTLDGDQAHSTAVGGAAALLHGYKTARWHLSRLRAMNGRGYGLGWEGFPTQAGTGKQGPETDLYIEFCEFLDNGAATGADGVDIKASERVALNMVLARGNSDKGINIRGRYVDLRAVAAYSNGVGFDLNSNNSATDTDDMDSYFNVDGCAGEGNTGEGLAASATEDSICHITVTGFSARKNLGTGLATHAPPSTGQVRATVNGGHFIGNGLDGVLMNKSQASIVTGIVSRANGRDGCRFTDCDGGGVDNSHLRGNTGWGVRSTGTSDRIRVLGNDLRGNTAGTRTLVGAANVVANNVEA